MQGVGPGTVLGGRYALHRRLPPGYPVAAAEQWSAHDTTLQRTVWVTVFAGSDPNASAALDAARRAAAVVDVRASRILDVGTDAPVGGRAELDPGADLHRRQAVRGGAARGGTENAVSFVVEEALPGARSLTELLDEGPLPPEEARRIGGEVAVCLETARQRGLHHLLVTPHLVRRTADGSVKLAGVAVAAALAGIDGGNSAAESRTDAEGVLAVVYAALTGRWPLADPVRGVDGAPRVGGVVVSPAEIATGVPGDLDQLCRETLGGVGGPLTPGEVAQRLQPWADGQVDAPPIRAGDPAAVGAGQAASTAGLTEPGASGSLVGAGALARAGPPGSAPADDTLGDADGALSGAAMESTQPATDSVTERATDKSEPAVDPAAAARGGPGGQEGEGSDQDVRSGDQDGGDEDGGGREHRRGIGVLGGVLAGAGAAAAAAVGKVTALTRAERAPSDPERESGNGTSNSSVTGTGDPEARAKLTEGSVTAGAVTAGPGTAGPGEAASVTAAVAASSQAPGAGSGGTAVATRAPAVAPAPIARSPVSTRATPEPRTAHLPEVLTVDQDQRLLEPPLPLLPPETGLNPPPGQSRLVVMIVGLFVLISLVGAYCGLRGLGSQIGLPQDTSRPSVTPTVPASTSAPAGPTATTTATGETAGPIAILSARGFDPQGDGKENNAQAGRVYDGKANTRWRSEGYKSATFAGLKKGVGILLDLGQEKRVGTVVLNLSDDEQDVQVLASNGRAVSGAYLLGKVDDAKARVTITAPAAAPARQFVIVWFTRAAPEGDKFRATLAEVALS